VLQHAITAATLQVRDANRMTYRLEGGSAVVAIRAWLAAGTARRNVWVVRLLAVGHGGGGGEFGLLEACDRCSGQEACWSREVDEGVVVVLVLQMVCGGRRRRASWANELPDVSASFEQ
jgi:hypothetical protein